MGLRRVQFDESELLVSVEELKEYMGYNGGKQKELEMAILSAMRHFEDVHNISLRAMTLELSTQSDSNGVARLYCPLIERVNSVVDINGASVQYSPCDANENIVVKGARYLKINYQTVAIETAAIYKMAVTGRAALIFEGSTDAAAYKRVDGWV